MKKPSFIKQIDNIFTKVTVAIIGDVPLNNADGRTQEENATLMQVLKSINYKESYLALGTPKNNELLYENVTKTELREERKAKIIKKLEKLDKKSRKAIKNYIS
jgi:nitrogenase subunit NifH